MLDERKQLSPVFNSVNTFFLPTIVIGELYFGAYRSGRPTLKIAKLNELMQLCEIAVPDAIAAEMYGSVKHHLKEKGTPIPENDIWIAAIALKYDCPLITSDKHFSFVPELNTLSL